MNTIRNYVESVFIDLPRTVEMLRLKEEMLSNMEEKYLRLKEAGSSENEAIGTVLAEFGNIDEILESYELEPELGADDAIYFTEEEASEFLHHRTKYAMGIAIGVFLCIMAPALLLAVQGLYDFIPALQGVSPDTVDILSLIPLFLLIAAGVGIFIVMGMREGQYKLKYRSITLESSTEPYLRHEKQEFQSRFIKAIASGVILCILAPAVMLISFLFLGEENVLPVVFLLSFVAVGVFLFVFYGILYATYDRLLAEGDYTPEKVKAEKTSENIAGIVFPIAGLIYLLAGFLFNAWGVAWIILFAIFTALYHSYLMMKRGNRR